MSQNDIIATLRTTHKKMLLNKLETAAELGISRAQLDRLRDANKIDAKLVGGKVMFRLDEIARYLSL